MEVLIIGAIILFVLIYNNTIDKNKFFKGIIEDGVFPRKTFSTGHAQEKRYYLEARKIVSE